MTTRDRAPLGAPCWADLETSDVEGARRFYGELFDWEPAEPSPEFGGYFMFNRDGVPVAGGMGGMPGAPAGDRWKVYLATGDLEGTLERATAAGAVTRSGTMPVADLGLQAVVADPAGAVVGLWQPGTFPGFTVLAEPGAPGWFELHTRDHAGSVAFYGSVLGLEATVVGDSDEFRYTTLHPVGHEDVAGVMDAKGLLGPDEPSAWVVYWAVTDADATAAKATALGGKVLSDPEDTPYGRLATVADPAGATFKLVAAIGG